VGPRAGLAVENLVVASVEGVCYTWRLCRSKRTASEVKANLQTIDNQMTQSDGQLNRIESEKRIRWLVVGCCRASAPGEPAPAETVGEEPTTWMRCGGVGGERWSKTWETRGAEACRVAQSACRARRKCRPCRDTGPREADMSVLCSSWVVTVNPL
jgi:hypothetical protein